MKKILFLIAAALCLPPAARAGEIIEGSVPGTINYQGRLERDNAPITGPVHLYFRLFNSATANNTAGAPCGSPTQPCVWQSPELTVQAAQGIFSAELAPGIGIFTTGQKLYLEVQVESDTLSPREPLNSITYALVAKKLEDGASVIVTTLTAGYQVLLATKADSSVGIGITGTPNGKLEVNGDIRLTAGSGGVIWFQDGTFISASGISSAGGLSAPGDAIIIADSSDAGTGNIFFRTGVNERVRILNNGNMGIGTLTPFGKLDVNGSLYVGNEGIYDRVDGEVNIKEDLIVEGGKVTGANSEYVSLGETNNVIGFFSNGGERARIHSNDYLGVGVAAPTAMIHSGADIAADDGVRGGRVSIGDYSTWTNLLNEVRAENGYHLLLQQTSPYNVGIGTNTPREKLHVRGSVRSDYGIMAATAVFSGDVRVNGEFRADGANREVFLTSTTIYGDSKIYGNLLITGGIGSVAGMPAYIASTQTFSGANTFLAQVSVSSDLASANRLGAGVADFDFAGSKYLQVGDNKPEFANINSLTYLVAGSSAEAKINFYRGAVETARLETVSANNLPNLGLVLGGQVRTLTDSVYHRVQNSVLWISTGYAGTPTIFASSSSAIVGIGTIVTDPNWRLTVAGNMRISGSGNGIFFPDGTSLTSGNLGALSVGNVSNNSDAVIQSDADQVSGGDVILRAGAVDGLVLKSGGNIGVGTVNPVSKLNVRGGDLVLGTPVNPYSGDSVEDLIVGGNIVFDGEMLQRSINPVRISALVVSGDVFLSTGATRRTRIGSDLSPNYTLDVTGDINASGSIRTGNTARISNAGVVGSGGADATWDGVIINVNRGGTGAGTFAAGGILYGNAASPIGVLPGLGNGGLLIGDGSGAPSTGTLTGTANQVLIANGAGSITLSLPQNIHTGASPAFAGLTVGALTGVIKSASGILSAMNGTASYNTYWSDANTLAAEQYTALTRGGSNADLSAAAQGGLIYKAASALAATGALTGVLKANGSGVPSAMTGTLNNLAKWTPDGNTIGNSIVSDNGTTATVSGALSVTGAGSFGGNVNMTSAGRINNLIDPSAAQDAATKSYVDNATGGGGAWGLTGNNINDLVNFIGTTGAGDDLVFKTDFPTTEKMRITSAGVVQIPNVSITGGTITGITALAVAAGGTGATTLTGVVRGNGAAAFTASAIGDADVPNTITLDNITQITNRAISDTSGTLAVGRGGTGATTLTGVLKGNGAAAFTASDVSLTTEVTGTLPVGNGGTGATTLTGVVRGNGAAAFTASAIVDADVPNTITLDNITQVTNRAITDMSGTLTVGSGGTGTTLLTSNAVLLGGASVGSVGPGAVNTVLRGTGGAPTFGLINENYTSGVDSDTSFTIIVSTQGTGTCRTMNVTNGMVTTISNTFSCY